MSERRTLPVLMEAHPSEFLFLDEEMDCPYLPSVRARFPYRLPSRVLHRSELSARLAAGDRRYGPLLYRPTCSTCNACRAIRLDATRFLPRTRHRRTLQHGNQLLRVELGRLVCDSTRVALFNAHLLGRKLGTKPITEEEYDGLLTLTCCESFELRLFLEDLLVAVAITDRADNALSAVYTYYNPAYSSLGLGTYAILKQLERCRMWSLPYLYLGLYVPGCFAMEYKARFVPNEQRIDGRWIEVTTVPPPLPRSAGTATD